MYINMNHNVININHGGKHYTDGYEKDNNYDNDNDN